MEHCQILAVGQKMPHWCETACQEYLVRLSRFIKITLTEIPAAKRAKTVNAALCMEDEGQRILAKTLASDYVVALEVKGKAYSTPQFAQAWQKWREKGKRVVFVIGGPDGLSKACLERADARWSLSELTFPHPLARVLLIEQLYRGCSLLENHPYHRE